MKGRPSFGHGLLLSMLAAFTTWAALMAWRGFLGDAGSYLAPLATTAFVVAFGGALLRWLGGPAVVTVLVQAVLAVAMVSAELGGGLLPVGDTGAEIVRSLEDAMDSARTYAAPIGANVPSVAPLLLVGGVFFVLLVDFLACTLRRVPIAGLALLAIYSVPAGLVQSGPGLVPFLLASSGFLALLHIDNRDHLLKWGRPLGPDDANPWLEDNPVADAMRVGAGRIGVAATVLAILLPPFVPVLELDIFGIGPGDGDDNIEIRNPRTDLRKDLEQGKDVPLIQLHTDDPEPNYLRVAVLNRFTGEEWSSGNREVAETTPTGQLPTPEGLSPEVPRSVYHYDFEATDAFDSGWLPIQFPAVQVDADDDWGFDLNAMDFIAVPTDLTTEGKSWSVTGIDPDYGTDGAFFGDSTTDAVPDEYLDVPGGLPAIVRNQALTATTGATNDYEAALYLQDWFRKTGGFEYEVHNAPEGIGGNAFETFLDKDAKGGRTGYCEQFASAMAVMARMVGIPSRVAVGFLKPDPLGNGNFEYSSHDLHAWVELYFEGAGWAMFEPTPSDRAETVPDYTSVPLSRPEITETATEESTAPTTRATTAAPTEVTTTVAPEEQANDRGGRSDEDTDWLTVLLWVALAVVVLAVVGALLLTPRTLRQRARKRRLAGTPEDLWDELRATSTDLGTPWPSGRSPQEVGRVLIDHLGNRADDDRPERPRTGPDADPEAAAALERLVSALELARYARPGTSVAAPGLADDARTCCASLAAGVTPRVARRARWWPRSVWERPTGDKTRDNLVRV